MADQPARPATETIPSVRGQTSAIASANAPIILIDEFSNSGQYNGIVHITCEALRFLMADGVATHDRVIVAHLRMNLKAFEALKATIVNIDALIADPSRGKVIL
jgi:hypothetical protein